MVFLFADKELGLRVRNRRALRSPPAKVIRQSQTAERLSPAKDVRALVKAASGDLQGMILLGINCGFGPRDCIMLAAVDGEWHNHGRPKTGVARRGWLWPETRKALQDGLPFRQYTSRHSIAHAFADLANTCKVENYGFYSLRRTFERVAGTAGVGQFVVDRIMGHAPRSGDMGEVYRQRAFDDQLRKCSQHVRKWCVGRVRVS